MKNIIEITDVSFDFEVLQSSIPVLVDFWAPWCAPCKMLMPTLESVAEEFNGKIKIAKLNIDDNSNTPSHYNVRSIPTLILFNNKIILGTKIGSIAKAQLIEFIKTNISVI